MSRYRSRPEQTASDNLGDAPNNEVVFDSVAFTEPRIDVFVQLSGPRLLEARGPPEVLPDDDRDRGVDFLLGARTRLVPCCSFVSANGGSTRASRFLRDSLRVGKLRYE